jgi:hypothetical protein
VPGSDKQNPTITGGEGFWIHLDGDVSDDPVSGNHTSDEIRFGVTRGDVGLTVVPEPSAFGLLFGAFAATLLMLRRRR